MRDAFRSGRAELALAAADDIGRLEELEAECDEYFSFDPPEAASLNKPIRRVFLEGDHIPELPEGEYGFSRFRLYCVRARGEIIGWLTLYLGYGSGDAAYIGVFYIGERHRGIGIGGEAIEALERELAEDGYFAVYAHCSLRNAVALRFWAGRGYDRIVGVRCDGNLYPDRFGGVKLMRRICESEVMHGGV